MRALRKIIFINSAHIRYSEIKLDGNVHFIGTQGVGKSTLLRAILFFYNADKTKLGIPKEMKSFDEFYLPYANSYIVYEVEHEHGPFSILVFRSSGRACFRFIDAPFHKEWLVDSLGEVTADSKTIRERAKDLQVSRIVDRYTEYLDILYGNKQSIDKEFVRFHLMESNRYQNVPRSIQNVFLNSRLDADFIKEIIIRSMGDEEHPINLAYYRRAVEDFEQEFNDISCWYKRDKKNEYPVKKQAENVVETYNKLNYYEKQIAVLSGELKYAIHTAENRLPLVTDQITKLTEEKQRQVRLFNETYQKYESEKNSLNQSLGLINGKLKEAKEKKSHYESLRITEVLQRYDKGPAVKQQLESLLEKRNKLVANYNDIDSKYKALQKDLESQLKAFKQEQQQLLIKYGEEKNRNKELLLKEHANRKADIEDSFAEELSNAASILNEWKSKKTENEKCLLELKYLKPFEKEIKVLDDERNSLYTREKELNGLIRTCTADIARILSEYEKKETEIKTSYSSQFDAKQKEIDDCISKIKDIDGILSQINGSLFEWLEENKKDWEEHIGKVIHEEKILYHTGLHPVLDKGESFYGVKLELDDLPLTIRKPKQLKEERDSLDAKLTRLKQDLKNQQQECEDSISKLKEQYASQKKQKQAEKISYETEVQTIPNKVKTISVQIEKYKTDAAELIDSKKTEFTELQQEIAHGIKEAQINEETIRERKRKKLNEEDKNYDTQKKALQSTYDSHEKEIKSEIQQKEQQTKAESIRLQQKELDELKGHGADTTLIDECNKAIEAQEQELKYINSIEELVHNYRYDKKNLFDHEETWKGEKSKLNDKLSQLTEKYEQRRKKHNSEQNELNDRIRNYQEEQKEIEQNLNDADRFIKDKILCPPAYESAEERKTNRTPGEAVNELKNNIFLLQQSTTHLKQHVNIFRANFSAKNTFKFPTELTLDKDFLAFAENLNEFLIYNKLEEYRTRTSNHYLDILARVSKELGDLTRNESEVEKIINDINKDFKERNFAGVIKLIALQPVSSADKMVQLMKHIKNFHDENHLSIGEATLFSTSNRDEVNNKTVDLIMNFMKTLRDNPQRQALTLSDLFQLQFRIIENDNDTGWADKISHVGSEGTDTLVKAMINIMLINVFKEKVSKRFGDFRLHCMMDEIGKLHPQNIKGILDFANARNILLINSSPITYNVSDYRYTYLLKKNEKSQTEIEHLIARK